MGEICWVSYIITELSVATANIILYGKAIIGVGPSSRSSKKTGQHLTAFVTSSRDGRIATGL
jgi:hypothetical protein